MINGFECLTGCVMHVETKRETIGGSTMLALVCGAKRRDCPGDCNNCGNVQAFSILPWFAQLISCPFRQFTPPGMAKLNDGN
jgi:hypothetical protein